jgi:tripartite-type tricarboxylate transporter receptor subunit TctC
MAGFAAMLFNGIAIAQPYPHKPIRVVVPSQAGGGADIVARAIAQKMSEAFGQQVVVDNRIGIVGAEIVANLNFA